MARAILFLMLFAALALAVAAALTLLRVMRGPAPVPAIRTETSMPQTVRTVSFVLLLALLLGVAGGWMGPS